MIRRSLKILLEKYRWFVKRHYVLAQSVQSSLLMGAGDAIAQIVLERRKSEEVDYRRIGRWCFLGAFVAILRSSAKSKHYECTNTQAQPMKHTDMRMEKFGSEDLETSGSGYAYHVSSGLPHRYASYHDGKFDGFGDPPITLGRYSTSDIPPHYESLPLAHRYDPVYTGELFNSYGYPVSYAQYAAPVKGFEDENHAIGTSGDLNFGSDSSNFVKGGGSSYEDAKKASHGEKGQTGYLNRDEYEKGAKGQHEKEQQKGYFNEAGGNKAGSQDVASHYANRAQSSKASHGESFKDKQGHKKGSKTSGYHKVYHKDEFKKDHSSYDKADSSGSFKRYGNHAGKQGAAQGAFQQGGHHNSGSNANDYGAKGFSDKGRFVDEARGYNGAVGKERYHKNEAEYTNKAGRESGQAQGFSEGDKYGIAV